MIKIGDRVKVYVDPLTCKELEFTGTVKRICESSSDNLVYCDIYDHLYEESYARQININNH